jgi:hypothetical protein
MARAKKHPVEITEPQTAKPTAKPKRPVGAPSTYNDHIASVICIRLAEGESLREIVKTEGMPDRSIVYDWLLRYPEFSDQYTRAREEQADTLADEIISIADESPETNEIRDKEGNVIDIKIDSGYVAYQKQRIEARKWTAMKLKPKKYGERMQVAGDAENPLEAKVDLGIFETILKAVELKRQTESNV